jgi:serine/threonine protein phosphatase PrpC
VDPNAPVLGRPSPAAAETAALREEGGAGEAAIRADGGDADWCALRVASVAGVRHRLSGQPGQDSFAWAVLPDALVVAVADGLGGVPGSNATAGRAVLAAVEAVVKEMGKMTEVAGAVELPVRAGLKAANTAAAAGGATTLVVGLIGRTGEVCLARVGDSTAFAIGEEGSWWREVFTPPDDDGDVTVTAALPTDQLEPEFAAITLATADLLLLATDGIADPWRDGPSTVAPVLAASLAGRPEPLELAQLASFSRQGCHDDRTMLVVWRSSPPPPAEMLP